jgi:hypothetical protein
MKCKDIEPLLYLVREGELTEAEEKRLAAHLATCGKCRHIYESVIGMTRLIQQTDYNQKPVDSQRSGIYKFTHSRFLYVKGIAASLLLLIASSFIMQEADFYRNRSELDARFKSAENSSATNSGERDCVRELKRRYRVTNLMAEAKNQNLISEEELIAYVQQACASDAGDMNKVKNLLIQAGLMKTQHETNK